MENNNRTISESVSNSEVALVQNSTTALLPCSESVDCDDINTLSHSCESIGGDINVRSCNFSRYLESENNSSINEEVLNYLHMLINSGQRTTPESITTLKINIGKSFTVLLINLSVYLEYRIRNYGTHQQYALIIGELNASMKILTSIKENINFCTDQKYKDDFLRYVLLPILLDRAKKIADILRNIGQQPFQESVSPNDMDMLLSTYDRIARVIERTKDIDCKSYHELINDIQQLTASLENVDKVIIGGGLEWQTSVQIDLSIFVKLQLLICH